MKVVLKKSFGYADIIIYDNDIYHIHILGKYPTTIEQSKEIFEYRMAVLGIKKALILTSTENDYLVPCQETINYLKSSSRNSAIKGNAFLIKSFSQRLAVKTVSGLKEAPAPFAFFTSEEKAIDWLLSLKN